MVDEREPDRETGASNSLPGSRRDVLRLVAAGTVGGVAAPSLGQLVGPDTDDPNGGRSPTTHDVFVHQRDEGFVAVDSDGATIRNGSDGWSVLEEAIDTVPEGGGIFVNGDYESTSTLTIGKSIRMDGHEAFIDHRTPGEFVFRFEGEERYQTTLSDQSETGDNRLRLADTTGIEKGDLILLEEQDGDPVLGRNQPPGEPHSVLEVEDDVVTIEDTIVWRDGYPSGTLAYVIDPIKVNVSGFRMAAPAKDESYRGVRAHMCRESTFNNLWFDAFGSRGLMLEACANTRVRDCTVLRSADIDAGDGYGIQVWAGCHDIIVEGCVAKECRHPLSVTAGGDREVASRTITFRDCYLTADGSAAMNCHGGSAHDVRFEGCLAHTWGDPGVRTGAQETNVSGCEFRMAGHNAIDTRDDGQEMILTVTDTDVYGAFSAVHLDENTEFEFDPLWKLVHVEGVRAHGCNRFFEVENGNIDRVRDVVIRGCYWDEVEEDGFRLTNQIDGGIIESNKFGRAPNGIHVHARDSPTTAITGLRITGNQFQQPEGSQPFVQLAHAERCFVSENTFEAGSDVSIYVDGVGSTGNLVKDNAYFAPAPSPDPVDVNDGTITRDNDVYDTQADQWL